MIVTDNLFGDIITDLAAAVCGGIGLAASGNIDATRTNPSMFEPVHGSAPDIAGQGVADPTAAIMSVALLLSHVGEDDAAARVDKAVEQHLATRGDAELSTTQVGDRIVAGLLGRSVATLRRQCWLFAIGSTLFAIATMPGLSATAGAGLANLLCFVGSWFFTTAGWMQLVLSGPALRIGWLSAATQIRRDDPVQHQHWRLVMGACRQADRATSGVGART